jgi:ankyrin repeat protein
LDFYLQSPQGQTILHAAAACNRPDVIEYLVRVAGMPVDGKDNAEKTALHLAVEAGAHHSIRRLLANKADPSARTNGIETPLHLAAAKGDGMAVDILLSEALVLQNLNGFKTYSDGFSPLMAAARAGHADVVEKMLAAGADPNLVDNKNRNSLFIAVESGHPDIARMLIKYGADVARTPHSLPDAIPVAHFALCSDRYLEILSILYMAGADLNAVDGNGQTAMHRAVDMSDEKKVNVLLSFGARFDLQDKSGLRPIDIASNQLYRSESVDIIRLLLDRGADTHISPFAGIQSSPLHSAVRYDQKKIVQLLLERHAMVDERERSPQGATAFLLAVENGHYEVGLMLLEEGADLLKKDKFLRSALHLAARRGSKEFLEMLMGHPDLKDHIDTPDVDGMTPLHYACRSGGTETVEMLLRAGANPWIYDVNGMTPAHYAVAEDNDKLLSVLEECVGPDADWNIRNRDDGETLLHVAARTGIQGMVNRLLDLGIDLTIRDKKGMTPLLRAIAQDQISSFEPILDCMIAEEVHPDRHKDNNGWTALHHASKLYLTDMAGQLLEAGADVHFRTPEGDTPLHIAVFADQHDVAELLIAHGARAGIPNARGISPMDIAKEGNNERMLEILSRLPEKTAEDALAEGMPPPPAIRPSSPPSQP